LHTEAFKNILLSLLKVAHIASIINLDGIQGSYEFFLRHKALTEKKPQS